MIVAGGNMLIAFMMYRLVHLVQNALAIPLDVNPSLTVIFVRVWWWPLIISLLVVAAIALPRFRTHTGRFTVLIAILLIVEVAILFLALAAFAVPLSHVSTPEMLKHGAVF